MLLGTDMPIFGGGTHPCISLRLRDMSKPISVLTGIDYWLDNLMSNVPEVVMCYHINGIVQKYELIKTEDLPRLDNSKFSPKFIRDVAQSILSFLKSNATKAGHTYWLLKGKDEEVVKLYDLTSLCSEEDVQKGQNPFTIPVAMLLYRVGRNMKNLPDRRPQPGMIRMLLKNVIKLLPEEKYPETITSSHYMLSAARNKASMSHSYSINSSISN
ncbi:erythroid differentiation-related factor 1-like [Sitophilus oryzae]|uniref:Erythroid differentiation-related factor 1-like n=1 Tax=Sitophilus oryzae TaxID=7048 RepID=A0A6J2X7P3_SITOR|nr:erythroid differentiation-related factor 1-like [Sitophilus oryzae]